MSITIIGRQLVITPELREFAESRIKPLEQERTLKISSVNLVIVREKNRFSLSLVFNCKYHVVTAKVTDFDLFRAIDEAALKIAAQFAVLKGKIQHHQAVSLAQSEGAYVTLEA